MRIISNLLLISLLALSCRTPRAITYHVDALVPEMVSMDSSIVADARTDAYISTFRDSVSVKMNRVIGRSDVALTLSVPESPMSNFVADLMLNDSQPMAERLGLPKTDIAVVNIKGLRTQLPAGELTVGNIYQLMPFENEVVLVELSGNEVIELFEHMASMGGDGIAGATFTIRNGKVEDAKVGNVAVEPGKRYCIATSDYMANGGDKYYVFLNSKQMILGVTLRSMILNHIETLTSEGKRVQTVTDGRISYAK